MAFPAGRYSDQVDALSQALNRAFNNKRRGEVSVSFARAFIELIALLTRQQYILSIGKGD
jgi:hypothetical protein